MTKYVYTFGNGAAEGKADMKNLLGGKGANLAEMNLIGVYGSDSNRRALIRLPNGRYKKVQVGDKIEGSKVTAISADAIRLVKGSKNVVLSIPKG